MSGKHPCCREAFGGFSLRKLMTRITDVGFVQLFSGVKVCMSKPTPLKSFNRSHLNFAEARGFRDEASGLEQKPKMSFEVGRKEFTRTVFAAASFSALSAIYSPRQTDAFASPFAAPMDLVARVGQRAPRRPEERLFEEDLFYPDYFAGVWKTESKLVSVTCPAGYKLFGKPGSFEAAQRDLNHVLEYPTRFIKVGKRVISDRPFNVKAIAEASMGSSSVLDCIQPGNTPNQLTTVIRPRESGGGIFQVKIKALARQQQEGPLVKAVGEGVAETGGPVLSKEGAVSSVLGPQDSTGVGLYTSEMVRQEVRLDTDDLRAVPLIREIETTTLFVVKEKDDNCIQAWQKTSSYLTRSNLQYVDTRGRPVDVRWYQLKYTRQAPKP